MDEYRPRPGDEEVEPLFAGLGLSRPDEARAGRVAGPRLAILVALTLGGGLVAWWLS